MSDVNDAFERVTVGRSATITDDTPERKRNEAQVRLASRVIETTPDAIVVSDADDREIMVNPAFSKMTGFSGDEMLGRRLDYLGRELPPWLTASNLPADMRPRRGLTTRCGAG